MPWPRRPSAAVRSCCYWKVDDPEDVARRAIAAGASEEMPVQEMFWGERYGVVRDPFGHRWALSTARQEYTPDDIASHTPSDAGR
jgi:PhnB protein